MSRLFVYLLILLLSAFGNLFSQSVAVSEYSNGTYPNEEWIELIILEDNTSLAECTLRDNSESGNWQNGVKFKSLPLWQHLREGTIILIHNRGAAAYDTDSRDGFINICADNDQYFDFDPARMTPPINEDLNFNRNCDGVQLINPQGQLIHSFVHYNPPIPACFQSLNGCNIKLEFSGNLKTASVYANSISDYCLGISVVGIQNNVSSNNSGTPGTANILQIYSSSDLWRSLRQPKWIMPVLKAQVINGGILLKWNKAEDLFPIDSTTGYIILRSENSSLYLPADGKVYLNNEYIGNGEIIAHISNSQQCEYFDNKKIFCGKSYYYKVFAYRYSQSNNDCLSIDTNPMNARGRAYNESNYAEANIYMPIAIKPLISKANESLIICSGDTVVLNMINFNMFNDNTINWYSNDSLVCSNEENISITKTGKYYAKSVNMFSFCEAISDTFSVEVLDRPNLDIYISDNKDNISIVKNDTIISLCSYQILQLQTKTDPEIEILWLKDEMPISDKESIYINNNGIYQLKTSKQGICFYYSPKINIEQYDSEFELVEHTKYILIGGCESSKEFSIYVKNNSELTNIIDSIIKPPNSSIVLVSPKLPIKLLPKSLTEFVFAANCLSDTIFFENIIFDGKCKEDIISINICKNSNNYPFLLSQSSVDFGIIPNCSKDTSISITLTALKDIYIDTIFTDNPFFNIEVKFINKFILKGEKFDIIIKIFPNNYNPGIYCGFLNISIDNNIFQTKLNADIQSQFVSISNPIINFADTYSCKTTKDTIIFINNNSAFPVFASFSDNYNGIYFTANDTLMPFSTNIINAEIEFEKHEYAKTASIFLYPCLDTIEIIFQREIIKYNFEIDTVNFGTIPYCLKNKTDTIIKFNMKKIDPDSIYIENQSLFNVSLLSDTDSAEIVINLNNLKLGLNVGLIEIYADKCAIPDTLYIVCQTIDSLYSVSSDIISFEQIYENQKVTNKIKLSNISDFDLEFELAEINHTSFSIKNKSSIIKLDPFECKDIVFEYIALENETDTSVFVIKELYPCSKVHNIILIGNKYKNEHLMPTIFIDAPAKIYAIAGEEIDINLNINFKNMVKDQQLIFDSELKYDKTYLYPLHIACDNEAVTDLNLNESIPGKSDLSFKLSKADDLILMRAKFQTLGRNFCKTTIEIDSSNIEYGLNNYSIDTKTKTEIELISKCGSKNEIEIKDKIIFNVNSINLQNEAIKINVIMPGKSQSSIYISSIYGQIINIFDGEINENQTIRYNASNLAKGIYFITLQTIDRVICKPILVI